MALQVWLPLNKNYTNKGLNNDVSATGTMVFSSTGSPTNGCYKFSATQNITISGVNFSNLKNASISLWVWEDSLVNTVFFTGPSTSHYIIAAGTNGTSDIYHSPNVGGARTTYVDGVASEKLGAAGAWHHYVITDVNLSAWTGTVLKFNNYSSSFNFAGRVRDIRIYDNVLTEKDVKELYWGKVFEFTPKWVDISRACDASGFNFPLTPYNLTADGNAANFNGSSSKVEFDGLKMTGGTISIWFSIPAKPTVQRVLYFDPVSKIVVGFLSNGNICAGTTSGVRYLTTGITWGQLTHVVIGFNTSYAPQYCLINGVQAGTNGNENWSNSGTRAAIGVRLAGGANNWFNGSINEIKVFSSQLTVADAKTLYEKGPCTNNWGELSPVEGQFIRLTGTQYFDSLLERRDDYTIEVCIQSESQTNDSPVFGLRTGGSKYQFVLWQNTNVLAFWLSNSAGTKTELKHTYNPQTDLLKKQVITCNRTTLKIDGAVVATAASKNYGFPSSPTIKLFTLQTGTGIDSRKFKGKVYYVKVWNGSNELIRHWVPKIDTTKGVGLFDIVNNVFYENKGTGVCTIGHD